jgi:hypothetical protein
MAVKPTLPQRFAASDLTLVEMHRRLSQGLDTYTQSAFKTFLQCPQKYLFQYVMGIRPAQGNSVALWMGSLVHEGMAAILEAHRTGGNPYAVIEPALQAYVEAYEDVMLTFDPLECQLKAQVMLDAWVRTQLGWLGQWEILGTEEVLEGTLHTSEGDIVISGKLDTRIKYDNHEYIGEHKTTAQMSTIPWVTALSMDLQAHWYAILWQLTYEKYPEGFLYNVLKKPSHKFTASKSDANTYLGKMNAAIDKDPSKYFGIEPVLFDLHRLEAHRANILAVASNVKRVERGEQPCHCDYTSCSKWGSVCPYFSLCSAGAKASDPTTYQELPDMQFYEAITTAHEEL